MSNEVELKLEIAERDVWRLLRLPLINAVTLKKFPGRRLQNTYYDTADYRLRELGIAVRLRQIGGKWLQTIKTEGRVIAGLHERPEWESETTAHTLDFSQLQDAELKSLLEKTLAGATLQPVFSTDGTQCELCVDRGKIIAGDKEAAISELELEIIAGHPVALFDFVRSLLEHVPLKLARDSKAARGFALALGAVAKPMKAAQAPLDKHMTTQQGFVAIATACMDQLMANEAGCIAADDTEYVHQMRVAIRRLRTAIHLFADHLDAERMNAIVDALRWLGTQLGTTRDFDVFLEETLPPVLAAWPQHHGLTQVRDEVAVRRNAALAASREAVQSARYQRLLLDISAWLVSLSRPLTGTNDSGGVKLAEFANNALKRHRKQLIQRAHHLMELSAEERHRVRISGKRLRYAAEFFSPLFPAKRSKPYIQELANLQTILGVLNDAATTKTILSLIGAEKNNAALTIVQTWVLGVTHGHLAHLPQAHSRFLEQQKFW
jgi:triphosphatase